MPRELLTVNVEADGSQRRVVAVGEIDLSTAPNLENMLRAAADEAGVDRVVADLAGVTFLDSSGLRVLCKITDLAKQDGFAFGIARPSDRIHRLLVLTCVDQVVDIVER